MTVETTPVPWWEGPLLAFDTETTAPDPDEARLVSVTCDLYQPGHDEPTSALRLIVNPGVPIPPESTEVHGITDERAQAEGVAPAVALAQIVDALHAAFGTLTPVVAYNARYDFTVLDRECARHLGEPFVVSGPVVDPLIIDKSMDPYVKGTGQRQLVPTCARYGIDLTDAHDATADARAAVQLARAIGARYPRRLWTDLRILWRVQQRLARHQATTLTNHFERSGKVGDDGAPIEVEKSWPVQARPAT